MDEKFRAIVAELESKMNCNCDLDNWQPESNTGHSWVCRIHKSALKKVKEKVRGEGNEQG